MAVERARAAMADRSLSEDVGIWLRSAAALPLADGAERALRDAGRAIEKDVLESLRDLDNARAEVERARSDFALAGVELERLQGEL